MTLASGALSGLTLDGKPVRRRGLPPFRGRQPRRRLRVRDDIAVTAQARADGLARDIVARFQDPAVDADPRAGCRGSLHRRDRRLRPRERRGSRRPPLRQRAGDPARGGDLWRLRTGLGAAVPPAPWGTRRSSTSLAAATSAIRPPASAALPAVGTSLAGLAAELQSLTSRDGLSAQTELGFASARQETLAALEKRGGVDTDQEMQKLLLIEQVYAANARVITTIDSLINRLLEI
jgi:flagellar hook-associated protein 1